MVYVLFLAAFVLWWWSWAVAAEVVNWKYLLSGCLQKLCWPLTQSEKINKLNHIENENFAVTMTPWAKLQGQNIDLENIFSTFITDKKLSVLTLCEDCLQIKESLEQERDNYPREEWAEDMNGQITEDINVVNRNPKRYSTSQFYPSRPQQEIEDKIRQLEQSLMKGL